MEILDGAREDTQTGQVVALLLQPMQENNQGFKFTKMTQILVVGLPNTLLAREGSLSKTHIELNINATLLAKHILAR
jgi:hypothetical protein